MVFNFGEVDSLDVVPAEFKFMYATAANASGKFELKPEAKGMAAAYQGQANARATAESKVTALNTENAQRRAALKPYEDLVAELGITPEDPNDLPGAIRTHVGGLTEKVKGGDAFKGNLKKIQEEAEKRIKAVTEEKDKELGAMRTALEEHLIDKEVLGALAENKAKAGGRVLLPHVKQRLKVVKDANGKYGVVAVDDQGQARYNSAAQPMSVKDVVAEIKTAPEYAFAFESESAGGTGAPAGGSRTPTGATKPAAGAKTSTQMIADGLTEMQKKA